MSDLTPEQRAKLPLLQHALEDIAAPHGCMHGYWDIIFDLRAIQKGEKPFLNESVDWYIMEAEKYLGESRRKLPY